VNNKAFRFEKCMMVNCVVPVLADNPLTYNLVLVSLHVNAHPLNQTIDLISY